MSFLDKKAFGKITNRELFAFLLLAVVPVTGWSMVISLISVIVGIILLWTSKMMSMKFKVIVTVLYLIVTGLFVSLRFAGFSTSDINKASQCLTQCREQYGSGTQEYDECYATCIAQ